MRRKQLWTLFAACLAFRCVNGWAIRTSFDPDEFWQSLEVAHRAVFGYGYLTWEWKEAIRGYFHPLIFGALYWTLSRINLDSPTMMWLGPRLLQALFAATSDVFLFRLALKNFSQRAASWALFCQLSSWFMLFTATRTYSSCLEMMLTTVALFYWPTEQGVGAKLPTNQVRCLRRDRQLALLVSAVACVVRPTSAVVWIYVAACHLARTSDPARFVLLEALPIGLACLGLSTGLDRVMYGRWVVVPLNFLRFNFLSSGARFYGTHPWHWYFTQGFPAITTTLLPLVLIGIWRSSQKATAGIIGWTLAVYSLQAHKEFRFLLPVLPLSLAFAGHALATIEHQGQVAPRTSAKCTSPTAVPGGTSPPGDMAVSSVVGSREGLRKRPARGKEDDINEASQGLRSEEKREGVDGGRKGGESTGVTLRCWVLLLLTTQLPMAAYFSLVHQRGTISVMSYLAEEAAAQDTTGILFLMPCHATPFYSHIHAPVPMRILDCSPSLREGYVSESAAFLLDPVGQLDCQLRTGVHGVSGKEAELGSSAGRANNCQTSSKGSQPSHLVMFDVEERQIRGQLEGYGYREAKRYFHAHIPVDRELQGSVVVYKLNGTKDLQYNTGV